MVFISKKIINGKPRYYVEHSFRLPNGVVKKISKFIADYSPSKKKEIIENNKNYFENIVRKLIANYAKLTYKTDHIITTELIDKVEKIKADYNKLFKILTKNQFIDILDRFTVNFTYESNAIEGNSLTLKDVTIIIKENVALKNKDLREVYETVNTRKAVELMFNNEFKITEKDIIQLHSVLVKDTGVNLGYKKYPNILLMRNTKTTPPEKVAQEMSQLVKWFNETKDVHPLLKAAVFHGRFEKIHPFEDGNGRTGRMLINVILLNAGYPPLIIRKSQRVKYFNALEAFDYGHQDKLKRFLIEKYSNTYEKFFEMYVKYL